MDETSQRYAEECLQVKCIVCKTFAKDQLGVFHEMIEGEVSVYTDMVDSSKWVSCDKCGHFYHLHCATQLSEDVVSKNRFICDSFTCKTS